MHVAGSGAGPAAGAAVGPAPGEDLHQDVNPVVPRSFAVLHSLAIRNIPASRLLRAHANDTAIAALLVAICRGERTLRTVLPQPPATSPPATSPPATSRMAAADGRSTVALLAHAPQSTRLAIVFSGANALLAMPAPLVGHPSVSTLLLRDPQRRFCIAGMPPVGHAYDECRNTMARIADICGAGQPPVCIGISAGGFAALRFGLDLQASAVLGFSVPTTLNIDDDPQATLRRYPQLAAFYKHHRALGRDVVPDYLRAKKTPRVRLLYDPEHRRDSFLARRMETVPNTRLIPVANAGHRTFAHANGTMIMDELMAELLK
jgi:hypothetical protein